MSTGTSAGDTKPIWAKFRIRAEKADIVSSNSDEPIWDVAHVSILNMKSDDD